VTAIGVVGAGNMGSAIVHRLALGADVLLYDRDTERANQLASERVVIAGSLEEFDACEVVVLSLPSPQISATVIGALADVIPAGSVVIETSTVLPSAVIECERVLQSRGIHLVDAAILSGVELMRAGTTTLLVGGDSDAVNAASATLELLTPRRVLLGVLGAGMAAKVANNAVSHAVMVVLIEAITTAKLSGVPPEVMCELLAAPDGGLMRPLTHRVAERIMHADYDGGMTTEAARKDSALALALAQEHHVPLFAIQAAHTVYEVAMDGGLGRDDYAAIARLWEGWTGVDFAES
jgi:3-hydroxyisobutyrate dehydrogenase-like beta-hydroxyacid dehydrogenase